MLHMFYSFSVASDLFSICGQRPSCLRHLLLFPFLFVLPFRPCLGGPFYRGPNPVSAAVPDRRLFGHNCWFLTFVSLVSSLGNLLTFVSRRFESFVTEKICSLSFSRSKFRYRVLCSQPFCFLLCADIYYFSFDLVR
jgi:hypothetical protein